MKLTTQTFVAELEWLFKENAPVRSKPLGAVGKKGTTFYSPMPGNLKMNAARVTNDSLIVDTSKVGYVFYANRKSKKPYFIERTHYQFLEKQKAKGAKVTFIC